MTKWENLKEDAWKDVLFTSVAYEKSSSNEVVVDINSSLPEGMELILYTDKLNDTKKNEYRCAVFADHSNKKITCAIAGTRPGFDAKGFHDLKDDAFLAFGRSPSKRSQAQILNEMIIDSIGIENIKDYEMHYTGHSLGACMADIAAADMDIQLQKQQQQCKKISCITFDNPGAKSIVDGLYKKADLSPRQDIEHTTFNAQDNFINTLDEQVGQRYKIVREKDMQEQSTLSLFFAHIANVLGSIVPPIARLCNIISYGQVSAQVDSHSLSNFSKVLVQGEGRWIISPQNELISMEEVITGREPLKYHDRVFDALCQLKEENGNIGKQKYSMKKVCEDGQIKTLTFSELELNSSKVKQNFQSFESIKDVLSYHKSNKNIGK